MERHFTFLCNGHELVGCLHESARDNEIGVLVVVGGPQYRVGSHRQFVLLARRVAAAGYPVLRFDYRGMGDSCGEAVSFMESAADINAAITAFRVAVPGLRRIIVYGLCDGASAALMHSAAHPDVDGLVLINPWVSRDEQSSDARIRFYYGRRILDVEFWKKLLSGRVAVVRSIREFFGILGASKSQVPVSGSFRDEMLQQLSSFSGRVLFVLSGNDIVAAEFETLARSNTQWNKALQDERVSVARMATANHTMSREDWEEELFTRVCTWLERV